ncbi:SPFH domain-containing protein [Streptomyces vinaceus]|uniref:SPFH domain-containing protein n=1 Tax=Streptomyces vinaceus TaxID=1960 RepID=UPI003821DA4A
MYPTRTTSTTGTFRIPPAPPQAAAVRATGDLYAPALTPRPTAPPPPAASATPFPPTAWAAPEPQSAVGAAQPGHEPLAGLNAPLPYGTRTEAAPDRVTPLAAEPALTAEARTASALPPVARTRSEFGRAAVAGTGTAPEPAARAAGGLSLAGAEPGLGAEACAASALPSAAPAESAPEPADGAPEGLSPLGAPSGSAAESAAGLSTPGAEVGHAAEAGAAVVPAPHSAQPVAAAVLPGPCEASAATGTGTAQAGQPGRGAEAPVRALGTVVGGAEAAAPGVDAGRSVPAGTVALPHGRPAAEATWSEVPPARIRVEPEPVHALAGAGDRAEYGGSPYGHEPEHLGSVPAPAAHSHSSGVPTLRLRAESAPPAGPHTQLPTDGPAAPHTETGPGALRSHSEAGSAPAADAGARDVAAGSGPGPAREVPYVPQPQAGAGTDAEAGPRAPQPPAGDDRPGAQPAPQVPYVPQPQADADGDAGSRAPQPYARAESGAPQPQAGVGADAEAGPRAPQPPAGDDRPGSESARQVPYVPQPHAVAGAAPAAGAVQRGPQSDAGDQGGSGAADGVEAGPRGPHAEPGVGGSASPYADAGPRDGARTGQVRPVAGGDVGHPAQRYGEPWPPGAPAPHAPSAIGAGAESPRDIAARAVARGMEEGDGDGDTQGLPRVAPGRGAAAAEVPAHLPFPADSRPAAGRGAWPATTTQATAAARPRPVRAEPGRRVPRGDERLREHRGPVLPGWVGVGVGALALTGCLAVLWRAGAVPAAFVAAFGATPRAYQGLQATHWPPLAFLGIVALLALGGLGRAKAGHAWVLTLFGRYRGTVRRTGLTWVSPLLLRRRVDVRLRHWRSEPMPAVDSGGLALRVVVQVVWQVKDTARATLAVEDHTEYLAEQVESAMARVLSQLPADAFHEDAPTLRDSEAVGDALTRMLATETEAVGIEVYSAQPTRIEYAPEVAEAMRRRRVAAIDAKHRDTVLTSVVDAVDDTVHRLTSRGLVELDDYERKALVKDLTVAFYTGRPE